jgi:nucleotide-binding universal stress UspA family protein
MTVAERVAKSERSMIQKILAAVDGSPSAAAVVDTSLDIADRFRAKVFLFRVVQLPPQPFLPGGPSLVEDLPRRLEQSAQDDLTRLAAGRNGLEVLPPQVGAGQPWRAIIGQSETLAVDLIVVGSHSYAHWDRLLGTNSARVANHASRSVFIVHTPESLAS